MGNTFLQKKEDSSSAGNESYFKEIDLFIYRKYKNSMTLDATELTSNPAIGRTIFFNPIGQIFGKENKTPLDYTAKEGSFVDATQTLFLKGDVVANSKGSDLTSKELEYYVTEGKVIAKKKVVTKNVSEKTKDKITVYSDKMTGWPNLEKSFYEGNVKGYIRRNRVYEPGIDFGSKTMDLNMVTGIADLRGKVFMIKQELRADSLRGEIFLENYSKKLKYFVLYDDVKVVERVLVGTENEYTRRSFSEKLEGFMSEEKIVLTGYPKVYQLNDLIKGNQIVLRENNQTIEVDDANSNFFLKGQ